MLRNLALVAFAGVASATSFSGNGQLRALASAGNGTDLGCITDSGAWTVDASLCGTFTGTRSTTVYTTLTSLDGPCTLNNSAFACGADVTALRFWAWSDLLDDYDILAYGEQITYSSTANISEAANSSIPIRTYRTTDHKPWIWLGWVAL
ncbi:hypothetical protein TruAng_001406 [Truncatella angustata]|nr:hypothetical protein TruAng_001406 [Truncatella angustata]